RFDCDPETSVDQPAPDLRRSNPTVRSQRKGTRGSSAATGLATWHACRPPFPGTPPIGATPGREPVPGDKNELTPIISTQYKRGTVCVSGAVVPVRARFARGRQDSRFCAKLRKPNENSEPCGLRNDAMFPKHRSEILAGTVSPLC